MNEEQKLETNQISDKTFKHEQLEQIIKAILSGKYSWACFLFLYFAGLNPIDHIPYRTYIRLLKNNCQVGKAKFTATDKRKLPLMGLEAFWIQNSPN